MKKWIKRNEKASKGIWTRLLIRDLKALVGRRIGIPHYTVDDGSRVQVINRFNEKLEECIDVVLLFYDLKTLKV